MSRRDRWLRMHVANVDGVMVREWRYCPHCHTTATFYLLDGEWTCHRAVHYLMLMEGLDVDATVESHA